MEQYIKLFTPVSERVPETTGYYIVLNWNGKVFHSKFMKNKKWQQTNPTHWLDLSILTTKEAAVEFAKDGFRDAWYRFARLDCEKYMQEFINENKGKL